MKSLTRVVFCVIALAMALPAFAVSPRDAGAQEYSEYVSIWTYDADGMTFPGACYELVGLGSVCDDDGDGATTFEGVPYGGYTVINTNDLGPDYVIYNFSIEVNSPYNDFSAYITQLDSGTSSGNANVTIWVAYPDGSYHTGGACVSVSGIRATVCDEDGDGSIYFGALAPDSYIVYPEHGFPSGWTLTDQWIYVSTDQTDYIVYMNETAAPSEGESDDDYETGDVYIVSEYNNKPFYDACYELVGYSQVGCDDNQDGQIRFRNVPYGKYTVRQTADISPLAVDDFRIDFSQDDEAFTAKVYEAEPKPTQKPEETIDVALITRDPDNGKVIPGACYELIGYAKEACDTDDDGEVLFKNVPDGTYTIRQTERPDGHQRMNRVKVKIDGDEARDRDIDRIGIPLIQRPKQSVDDSHTYAVAFYDLEEGGPVINESCAELKGVSEVGCDDDLEDGQVDFLDVDANEVTVDVGNHAVCPYAEARRSDRDYEVVHLNDDITIIYVGLREKSNCD